MGFAVFYKRSKQVAYNKILKFDVKILNDIENFKLMG